MKNANEFVEAFLSLSKEDQAAAFRQVAKQMEVFIVTAYDREESIIEPRVRFGRAAADELFAQVVTDYRVAGIPCHVVMELAGEEHDADLRRGRAEYLNEYEQ